MIRYFCTILLLANLIHASKNIALFNVNRPPERKNILLNISVCREWYDNASCRNWFRRRPLEGAFTHPSKMVYPPGEYDSPRETPAPEKTPRPITTWEDHLPTRSPLNYEIGMITSESQ